MHCGYRLHPPRCAWVVEAVHLYTLRRWVQREPSLLTPLIIHRARACPRSSHRLVFTAYLLRTHVLQGEPFQGHSTTSDVGVAMVGSRVGPGSISTRLSSAHEPAAASAPETPPRGASQTFSGSRCSRQGAGPQRPPPAARGRLSARSGSRPGSASASPSSPPRRAPSSRSSFGNEVYSSQTGAGVVFDGPDGLKRVRL